MPGASDYQIVSATKRASKSLGLYPQACRLYLKRVDSHEASAKEQRSFDQPNEWLLYRSRELRWVKAGGQENRQILPLLQQIDRNRP
jgi:hypothetical protein